MGGTASATLVLDWAADGSRQDAAGECTRSVPVSDSERWAMLEIEGCSLPPASGHIITRRDHLCGDFKDEFDWSTLPLPYLKRVGAPATTAQKP